MPGERRASFDSEESEPRQTTLGAPDAQWTGVLPAPVLRACERARFADDDFDPLFLDLLDCYAKDDLAGVTNAVRGIIRRTDVVSRHGSGSGSGPPARLPPEA